MKIKQVEELVGITRKNIRFYEDQGLLVIERAANGYREYHMKDVHRLQEIKLLRKLDIPIGDMRKIFDGEITLRNCLQTQVREKERQKENLDIIQKFCEQMMQEHYSMETLDAELCLEQIEKLEQEGVDFMDIERTDIHKKKIIGAVLGAVVMIIPMIGFIGFMIWEMFSDSIPVGWFVLMICIPIGLIAGIVSALIGRMKEIKGGEEDEAVKY